MVMNSEWGPWLREAIEFQWQAEPIGHQPVLEFHEWMKRFAAGLQADYPEVAAALTYEWSNGPTEGHINRLKLVKRQMFGRAKLDLLRKRVMHRN